jgi:N-acetylglucosamine kinase-like BadF-type ATPase
VGRILLNDYLTRRMPQDIRDMFHDVYDMSDDQFIDAVYHRPTPNRFLASLAPFAVQRQADDYCHSVITEALYDWRHGMLEVLQQQSGVHEGELNVVGGFAKAIEPTLRSFMSSDELAVGTVMADPIDGLRIFHR